MFVLEEKEGRLFVSYENVDVKCFKQAKLVKCISDASFNVNIIYSLN